MRLSTFCHGSRGGPRVNNQGAFRTGEYEEIVNNVNDEAALDLRQRGPSDEAVSFSSPRRLITSLSSTEWLVGCGPGSTPQQ